MRSRTTKRLTPDAEKLVSHTLALAASSSRIEDRFWERQLNKLLFRLLQKGNQSTLDNALEHLQTNHSDVYGTLANLIESQSESAEIDREGQSWDGLLIAIPMLAWTRYSIPSGPIKSELLLSISNHLESHIVAEKGRVFFSPFLYSIDQLPRTHCEAWRLTQRLVQAAIDREKASQLTRDLPETAPIFADPRFLLAAIAVPYDSPMFRWQEDGARHSERIHCREQWAAQCGPNLGALLPGCEIETLLPDAYYASCREADERIRPHTIRTGLRYLEERLALKPIELRAIIAGFGEKNIDEYRISFTQRDSNDVIYGMVWPLYGSENGEVENDTVEMLINLLKTCGITKIRKHASLFVPEYCEDCGTPLYPDPIGEVVHVEMPEDIEPNHPHFH
ncbi:DUF2863 family protein [Candidatus Pandoraea novymonadis]|uniref:DUF2863 domain-containing protein n=1 Tax=Candidatus Pandoraea novymonadis TaxID=1808959 RepID=A0ABX5FEP1_9BURK|nr:DUF2863 family protein [Candidatus Pandoraea novymonadis]PSB92165.1 hypothetical protein BZL35_00396 [Candidatus Pandoraea novymonadis]